MQVTTVGAETALLKDLNAGRLGKVPAHATKSTRFVLGGIQTLGRRGNPELSFGACAQAVNPGFKTLHVKPCVNTHNPAHPAEKESRQQPIGSPASNQRQMTDWNSGHSARLVKHVRSVPVYSNH